MIEDPVVNPVPELPPYLRDGWYGWSLDLPNEPYDLRILSLLYTKKKQIVFFEPAELCFLNLSNRQKNFWRMIRSKAPCPTKPQCLMVDVWKSMNSPTLGQVPSGEQIHI